MVVNYFKVVENDFKIVKSIATKIPMTKMIKSMIKLPGSGNKYYVDTFVQRNSSDVFIVSVKLTPTKFVMK